MTTGAAERRSGRLRSVLGVLLVVAIATLVVSIAVAIAPAALRSNRAPDSTAITIDPSVTDRSAANFHDIAFNATTHRLYTTNDLSTPADRIAVVDTVAKQMVAVVQVAQSDTAELNGIAVDPVRNLVYASTSTAIIVLDGVSNAVIDTIPVPGGCQASGIAVDAATDTLYTGGGCGGFPGILAIDPTNGALKAVIPGTASQFVIDGRTDTIYAINYAYGKYVTVIDGATIAPEPSIPLSSFAQGLTFDPTTGALYVGLGPALGHSGGPIAVVDTTTNRVVRSIETPKDTLEGSLVVDPVEHVLYLGTASGVLPVDGATGKQSPVIPSAHIDFSLAVDSSSQTIFAPALNTLYMLPTASAPTG